MEAPSFEMDSVAAQGSTSSLEYVGSTFGTDNQRSSGYGHSGHSGYGHSGYGHSAHGGHSSGYGHGHSGHSGYGHEDKCCPLVVDLLCLAAILGAILGASLLLARVIAIEITPPGRRKKRSIAGYLGENSPASAINLGEQAHMN